MKITYITNARIPTEKAHGYQICKMCEEFSRAGADVELIVPTRKNPIRDSAFNYYGLKNNFKIRYIKSPDFLRFDKFLFKKAIYLNNLFFLIKSFFIKIDRKNFIYSRSPEMSWIFSVRGYKTFFEAHIYPGSKKIIFDFFLKKVNIVTITQGIKNVFVERGFDEKKIFVSPDAVDFEKFNLEISKNDAREKVNLPSDKKIIMYTGSFYIWGWKGVDLLIELSKNISNEFLFVLVGGSKSDLEKNDNKNSNLLLVEKVSHDIVPYYLKSADVLILPNKKGDIISEYYTSPLKLFEYMASGVPIVASSLPSIKEILNKENSFLFEANNVNDLLEKINFVLENKYEAEKRANKSYEDVKKYTWKERASLILCFLNNFYQKN